MPDPLDILQELKRLLKEHFYGEIKDVILFGSQATGTACEDSDYDVLIILSKDSNWKQRKAVRYVCYDIALKYDIFLDIKVISLHDLHHTIQGKHPLFTHALAHGVFA